MSKVRVEYNRTARVRAPVADVYRFFAEPDLMAQEAVNLDRYEKLDDTRSRWLFRSRTQAKGLDFAPEYTVTISGNGEDRVSWRSIPGLGNTESEGSVELRETGGATEIRYRQVSTPDLPVPKLVARMFEIIARKLALKDMEEYFDRVVRRFGPW